VAGEPNQDLKKSAKAALKPNAKEADASTEMAKLKSAIDADLIRELAKLLEETGLTEIEFERGGERVRVARRARRPAGAATPAIRASSPRLWSEPPIWVPSRGRALMWRSAAGSPPARRS
jgi:hypothetical protein